jgi:hypothetical protein
VSVIFGIFGMSLHYTKVTRGRVTCGSTDANVAVRMMTWHYTYVDVELYR